MCRRPTRGASACCKTQQWAQHSRAHRTIGAICQDVAHLESKTRMFQQTFNVLHVDRSNIVQGALLGRGAFCQVFQVELQTGASQSNKHKNNYKLALKQLRPDLKPHVFRQAAVDLIMEAQFLAHLSHPNIVGLCGWAEGGAQCCGRDDGGFFLLLERVDTTLEERIQKWKVQVEKEDSGTTVTTDISTSSPLLTASSCQPSRRQATSSLQLPLHYAYQIALALTYLHERDLVFRDLKPNNIGLVGDCIKLLDFGLCRELPESTPKKDRVFGMSGVGTRRYLAPEVVLGHGYNQKVDIYSWSLVLQEMLSLTKPFYWCTKPLHKELVCVQGQRPQLELSWPFALRTLLQQSWATNPRERPTMKEIVQERLPPLMHRLHRENPPKRTNTSSTTSETNSINDNVIQDDKLQLSRLIQELANVVAATPITTSKCCGCHHDNHHHNMTARTESGSTTTWWFPSIVSN